MIKLRYTSRVLGFKEEDSVHKPQRWNTQYNYRRNNLASGLSQLAADIAALIGYEAQVCLVRSAAQVCLISSVGTSGKEGRVRAGLDRQLGLCALCSFGHHLKQPTAHTEFVHCAQGIGLVHSVPSLVWSAGPL